MLMRYFTGLCLTLTLWTSRACAQEAKAEWETSKLSAFVHENSRTSRAATNQLSLFSAEFSGPAIQSNGLEISAGACFSYNAGYGNSWRLLCAGGSFSAAFVAPDAGEYFLRVWHLSSASSTCPGAGYAPVSIYVNGSALVERYDPAEHHAGAHGYVEDSWRFAALSGNNYLDWIADNICSHYWIQRIEVAPAQAVANFDLPVILPDGRIQLLLNGSNGIEYLLEASVDLANWIAVGSITTSVVFHVSSAAGVPYRFYRARKP